MTINEKLSELIINAESNMSEELINQINNHNTLVSLCSHDLFVLALLQNLINKGITTVSEFNDIQNSIILNSDNYKNSVKALETNFTNLIGCINMEKEYDTTLKKIQDDIKDLSVNE